MFVDEGFDVPASLRTVTESDLDGMGVKKGHKRAIMDAIKTIDHHVTVGGPANQNNNNNKGGGTRRGGQKVCLVCVLSSVCLVCA